MSIFSDFFLIQMSQQKTHLPPSLPHIGTMFSFVEIYRFVVNPLIISQNFIWISFLLKVITKKASFFWGGGVELRSLQVIQKLLVTSQSLMKISIQIVLHQRLQKRKWRETKMDFGFLECYLLKNPTSFSLSLFLYFRASNLGKIDANFSGGIVTSSAVLDHRAI